MEILSFAENSIHPKVDIVKGHVPFELMGFALVEKYGNPDFADSYLRFEYASFGEYEVDMPRGDTPLAGLEDDEETPAPPAKQKFEVLLNRNPLALDVEPVTILYYGNYSVPQA